MSNTIPTELHEEIVTELQYKLEELEREVDDLNEEIEEKKVIETLNDKKVREYSNTDESYNYAIEVCICYVEDLFKDLLDGLGG